MLFNPLSQINYADKNHVLLILFFLRVSIQRFFKQLTQSVIELLQVGSSSTGIFTLKQCITIKVSISCYYRTLTQIHLTCANNKFPLSPNLRINALLSVPIGVYSVLVARVIGDRSAGTNHTILYSHGHKVTIRCLPTFKSVMIQSQYLRSPSLSNSVRHISQEPPHYELRLVRQFLSRASYLNQLFQTQDRLTVLHTFITSPVCRQVQCLYLK